VQDVWSEGFGERKIKIARTKMYPRIRIAGSTRECAFNKEYSHEHHPLCRAVTIELQSSIAN
jgi:hypothetical protein